MEGGWGAIHNADTMHHGMPVCAGWSQTVIAITWWCSTFAALFSSLLKILWKARSDFIGTTGDLLLVGVVYFCYELHLGMVHLFCTCICRLMNTTDQWGWNILEASCWDVLNWDGSVTPYHLKIRSAAPKQLANNTVNIIYDLTDLPALSNTCQSAPSWRSVLS